MDNLLELLKTSLRIDHTEDDANLKMFIDNAESAICLAVSIDATPEKLAPYPQFKQAVFLLASHWYNVRYAVAQTTSLKVNNEEIPFGVSALEVQLRARYLNDN